MHPTPEGFTPSQCAIHQQQLDQIEKSQEAMTDQFTSWLGKIDNKLDQAIRENAELRTDIALLKEKEATRTRTEDSRRALGLVWVGAIAAAVATSIWSLIRSAKT